MLGGVSDEQVELSTRRLKETVTDLTALVSAGVNEEVLEAFQAKIAELTEQKLVISEDIQTDFANEYGILWGKLDEASTQIEVAHKATVRVEALQEVFSEITGKNPADLKESELNNYITLVGIADTAIRTLIENLNTRAEYNSNNIGILTQTFTTLLENVENNKKELGTMKRSLRDLLSEERITIELDLGEDVEVDASEVVATVAEAEDEAEDAEGAEDEEAEGEEDLAVDDELDAVEDEEAAEVMVAEEDIVLEVDGDDLEAALSEMVAEMTETEDEVEEDLNESEEVELTDDTVIEISESMLREELEKIRSLNEAEEVEEDTINENEDAQEVVAEEQNDQLKENVEAYEEAIEELKGQLGEMNLFNAKLLYTNKLLMNSDLTQAQRARAIESLDEARSLREVKLLFKTLTESFNKRSKETVTESTKRVIGSASRATRAAGASLNESSEASRWATLAGICK